MAEEPQPVPVNARFANDFVTQLVLVLTSDTMTEVAEKVAHHVVGRRLKDRGVDKLVRFEGRSLPPDITVEEAGIEPLALVYVEWADEVDEAPQRQATGATS